MGAAVTGALLAETKIAKAGLGFMIVEYYGQFRIADMYSLLLFVFILAALTNWAMKRLFGPPVTARPRQSRRRACNLKGTNLHENISDSNPATTRPPHRSRAASELSQRDPPELLLT